MPRVRHPLTTPDQREESAGSALWEGVHVHVGATTTHVS